MEKKSVREMIRQASQELGGLGVSPATRPGASPVKGTCPKGSSPRWGRGKTDQPEREGSARVIGWIPLPQRAVKRGSPNHRHRSSDSANESVPRPTTSERP